MFRLFAFLLSFLAVLAVSSNFYQWSMAAINKQNCDNLTACYTQLVDFGLASIAPVSSLYYVSLALMCLLIVGLLIASFSFFKTRVKLLLSALVLLLLIVGQLLVELNAHLFISSALTYFIQYIVNVLIAGIAIYMAVRSQLSYVKNDRPSKSYLLQIGMGLLSCQLLVGAWLTANHAGLVCSGFPQCNGSWWPVADYRYAFDLFSPLSFSAKVAVSWVHRLFVVVNFVTLTWVLLLATQQKIKKVRWLATTGSFLLLLLIASGVVSVKTAMPVWLIAAHSIIAVLLIIDLLLIHFYSRYTRKDLTDESEREVQDSPSEPLEEPEVEVVESIYGRLKSQLGKTRGGFGAVLSGLSLSNRRIDQELLEEIETSLLVADVGLDLTTEIIAQLEEKVEKHELQDAAALTGLLKTQLLEILQPVSQPLVIPKQDGPYVILVVGINGVGKTTTIGKLAQRLQGEGHSVMLAAGDTFRAAAVEQLQVWGERNNIHVVAQHTGADSASVIFDGVESARAKGVDVLIADTAGRLHTKANLMEELKKVKRIISRIDESAPHEVLLVLDAGTGQNALSQAEHFNKTVDLTGIALTKLDGTAKGGIIFALAKQQGIPIRFLGVGEGINDLQDFNAENFIDALFMEDEK
ncbi:MAG: signal recognition particle-docking protein FtsY [Methyloprofundus sp.]|nr:signal recognition particle-docking protein FtsY [Methyloprofundus sp.]